MSPYQSYAGLNGSSPLGEIHYSYEVPWQQANQMDEDARSIIDNRKMAVPGEEGLNDIRIVEAIYASVEQQKEIKVFS
jgi:glucose-fructose oxidoreductase